MPCLKTIFFLAVICCNLTVYSFAQNKETGVSILIKDQFDAVISNAEVTLAKSGKVIETTKTNNLGIARFSALPAGEYQLSITAIGFKEYKNQSLTIKSGETHRVEIVLEVASIESNVEVGEATSVDPEKSGTATVLTEKQIENLPDDPQELEKVINRIGEAVTGEQLPVTVNGVQGAKLPPKQAIQQIRINQNVFSAQYDNSYGGGIDIFTRAKVDKFSGYVNFSFADSHFNAKDPFIGQRVPYQARTYYFYLTGPLGKKANFSVYGSRNESDSSSVINAIILDSGLQAVPLKQSFATPSRSESANLVINADPNKKHKLYLSYSVSLNRTTGQNVGGFSLASRANNSEFQNHYVQLSDTYLKTANIVNQTRLSMSYSKSKSFGGNNSAAAINVLDAFFGGGSQQDSLNQNFRFDTSNETTWQMGRYALGFGLRIRGERVDQTSRSNFGGTYTFSGRFAPVLDAANNPVTDSAGNIVTAQISSLESYRRTLLFRQRGFSNQKIRELGGGASQFTISGGNPQLKVSQYDYAFYVQNSYKVSETLAASFGLRYENQTNLKSPFNFAPRFGFIWAPKAKEKQKPLYALPRISVGYGFFYTRFALNNLLNVRQADDPDKLQYLVTDGSSSLLDIYPSVPSVGLLQQFALPRSQRFIDSAFGTPYQSLLNLTATKKVSKGYSLNFTLSHGTSRRQALTQNINAPLAGTFNLLNPAITAVRPFGNVGNIYQTQSGGKIVTNRFSVNLTFPNSQKLYASLRYSFTKSKSNIVSGSGSPFDPYDFSQEFAPTAFDGVNTVSGYFDYQLPHKFSVGGDFSISSGSRFNIYTGRDTNGDGFYSERPSFATNLNKPNLISTKYGVLDPNPAPTDRLIPRNLGRGPSNFIFNGSLFKRFGFHEDVKNKKPPKQTLSFSLYVNNVFNIINKSNPIGNMSSPNFLRSLSSYSDGGFVIINGAPQFNFAGRSMSFSVGFGF